MKRLVLLLFLALFLVMTVPPLREAAAPTIDPAAELIAGSIEPAFLRVRDPFYTFGTRKELRDFARGLQARVLERLPLPDPRGFTLYLARQHASDGFDRWGQPFYLEFVGDSVIVGSPGRDRVRGTEYDIREGFSRTAR